MHTELATVGGLAQRSGKFVARMGSGRLAAKGFESLLHEYAAPLQPDGRQQAAGRRPGAAPGRVPRTRSRKPISDVDRGSACALYAGAKMVF